jgi:hypothetical protein
VHQRRKNDTQDVLSANLKNTRVDALQKCRHPDVERLS